MEASSKPKRTTLQNTPFKRSLSPSGRFCSSTISTSSPSSNILTRSISPTRVSLTRSVSPSPNVRFTSFTTKQPINNNSINKGYRSLNSINKRTCMCSPTSHPGSFRCSLHKNVSSSRNQISRSSHQLNVMRRSAMTNSLVRIGTVEGELVKRALAALIRPSSHSLRRRGEFMPRPSRLSKMSRAGSVD